jgi:hypothetical protein
MDLPTALPAVVRRNQNTIDDRSLLRIDPGPRSVSGRGQEALLDGGSFLGKRVTLGKIATDDRGHLHVLGGTGNQVNPFGIAPTVPANNVACTDDTSDGPISAHVTLGGRRLEVTPAWVIVAPPNYAPGIEGLVTLYDVVLQTAVEMGHPLRSSVSFTRDIYPILRRLSQMQWVSRGFKAHFGPESANNLLAPERLERLSSNTPNDATARREVFALMRPPYEPGESGVPADVSSRMVPQIYGDQIDDLGTEFRKWLTVTTIQYGRLKRWAAGDFHADWRPGDLSGPTSLEALEPRLQPRALDRAALEACLGGPFHPGIEAPWVMRIPRLYTAPFRVKIRRPGDVREYGEELTPAQALAEGGPLDGSGAGDVTRWLGVPWHADMAHCRFSNTFGPALHLPTFWPARAPDHVLKEGSYLKARDEQLDTAQRLVFFNLRANWLRGNPESDDGEPSIRTDFLAKWAAMGIVTPRPAPTDPGFPLNLREMQVEIRGTEHLESQHPTVGAETPGAAEEQVQPDPEA